jgi:2-polyprenyl-3-methyl-5-hydroxy-6-metoxy-1,4-benzoquinol methylase
MDLGACKTAELAHQERKYAAIKTLEPITISGFTSHYLKPPHKGGMFRGEILRRCMAALPDVRGLRVLDYACGRAHIGIYLALQGARVSAMDVSPAAVALANKLAKMSGVEIDVRAMDCERLDYPSGTFDIVIGAEALHHVIVYPNMPRELARVLKPGGKAIFGENWGGDNPLFRMWRAKKMQVANCDGRGEVILSQRLLEHHLGTLFKIDATPFSILYMAKKKIKNRAALASLYQIDKLLQPIFPSMGGESVVVLKTRADMEQRVPHETLQTAAN